MVIIRYLVLVVCIFEEWNVAESSRNFDDNEVPKVVEGKKKGNQRNKNNVMVCGCNLLCMIVCVWLCGS